MMDPKVEIEDALGAADGFLHAIKMGIESSQALKGGGKDYKDYAALHLLVDAAQAEIGNAFAAFDRIGEQRGSDASAIPTAQTLKLLTSFQDKDRLYREALVLQKPGDEDLDTKFKTKEVAQYRFLYSPSSSLADVRLKAKVALEDGDIFDSLRNCGLSDEHCVLRDFLNSLLGKEPVDNGGK